MVFNENCNIIQNSKIITCDIMIFWNFHFITQHFGQLLYAPTTTHLWLHLVTFLKWSSIIWRSHQRAHGMLDNFFAFGFTLYISWITLANIVLLTMFSSKTMITSIKMIMDVKCIMKNNACNTFIIHACWHCYKSNTSVWFSKILIEGIILWLIQGKG